MNDPQFQERYHRQLILQGFGLEAQQKLARASVLVIGAGGLGCPILQYLAATGVGHIGIADADIVSLSNLPRQILFTTANIGQFKTTAANETLKALNPTVNITVYPAYFTQRHCIDYFHQYDIIVDATDNFASRYLINDACVLMQKPLVFGAVSQFEGQIAVFNNPSLSAKRPLNYRDIFPIPPQAGDVLNCAEAGVLGILPGIIGTMQAMEVVKLITGIGQPLTDQLLTYNALSHQMITIKLHPNAQMKIPETVEAYMQIQYDWLCGNRVAGIIQIEPYQIAEILSAKNARLIDIREPHELPEIQQFPYISIPFSIIKDLFNELQHHKLLLICQTGTRSLQAATMMLQQFPNTKVYSVKGGVNAML